MISCLKTLRRIAQASICVLAPAAFAATQPVFPVLVYEPYAVSSPLAMAEGDLNGDGIVDTLYATTSTTAGSSTLTSSPRSASGTRLAPIVAGAVPCTANSILLADLNNDKKLDAVVTCNEGSVAILAGNGDGTFATATTYAVASAAKAVAADLNGDGNPDLAIGMNTGNTTATFAILLNTGGTPATLSFASPKVYGGTYGGSKLMVVDANNDGKPDVIAGERPDQFQAGAASVFYGNGDGSFGSAIYQNGLRKANALADFDGDGRLDIAGLFDNAGYALDTSIEITYANPSRIDQLINAPFAAVASLQPMDLNGDGKPDLVLAGTATTILLNDGTGVLSVGPSYATPGTFYGMRKGTHGTDLVFATPRGFYVLHGDGKGNFDGIPDSILSDTVAAGDVNNDGLTDYVGNQYVMIGRGNGTFAPAGMYYGSGNALPLLTDFDGDGIQDLLGLATVQNTQARMLFVKGLSGGVFATTSNATTLPIQNPNGNVAGDFNGDGKIDVVVSYSDSASSGLILVPGNGDGTFVTPTTIIASSGTAIQTKLLIADLNKDGKLDLVWGNNAYINQGNLAFTAVPLPVQGSPLAVGDLDGDGVPDLIIDSSIYAGKGDGTYLPTPLFTFVLPSGAKIISASIGDLNGDGHPDIVLQTFSDMAALSVAFGDGRGNFTVDPNVYITGLNKPVSGMFARLNTSAPSLPDSRLDYIVFADSGALAFLNQMNAAPGPLATNTIVLGPSTVIPLQPVNFQARVTGVVPTGTVTFKSSDGAMLGKGTLQNGPGYTYANQQVSFPSAGRYTVTANFSGDDANAQSVSNPATVTVAKFASTMEIPQFLNQGSPYYTNHTSLIYATVNAYSPTGQVTFSSGSNVIGSGSSLAGGVGTSPSQYQTHVNYVFNAPGSYSITANYAGDTSNQPSASSAYTITVVDGPDYTFTATPMSVTVKAGGTATYNLSIASLRNYGGYVTLSCQPACQTSQSYVGPGQTVTGQLTITTKATGSGPTGPMLRYGPPGAALLLLGFRRRKLWKYLDRRLNTGLFILCLALCLIPASGCSSGSSSSSGTTTTSTPYSIVLTAADSSAGISHSITLQLIIQN